MVSYSSTCQFFSACAVLLCDWQEALILCNIEIYVADQFQGFETHAVAFTF